MMNTYDLIPEEVLVQLGLNHLPEPERNEILSDISKLIYSGAMHKAFAVLDEGQQDELMALMAASNAERGNSKAREQVETFLRENVPDFNRFLEQESSAFFEKQHRLYKEITGKE
jgi:hypothetical protein